jgi:hypothetical protein
VSVQVPAHGGMAWRVVADASHGGADIAAASADTPPPTLGPLAPPRADGDVEVRGDFEVAGTAPGATQVRLVVDGDLARALPVPVRRGRWRARVDTAAMVDPAVSHRLVAWVPEAGNTSAPRLFRVSRPWQVLAEADDPAGDDTGPAGRYRYPTDWQARTLDLRHVRVEGSGGALRITLTMAATSTLWNPPNGFDHLAVNVYIALPGQAAETVAVAAMPAQNAVLPDGLRWNRRLRVHGWSNALFSSVGAGPAADGTPTVPAAAIAVDRAANTLQFTLAPAALGGASLSGARVFVTTWDYDGGYRPLRAEAAGSQFGGGDGARDPLWMDASPVLRLP